MRLRKRDFGRLPVREHAAGHRSEFTRAPLGVPLQEVTFGPLEAGRHTGDVIEASDVRADWRGEHAVNDSEPEDR
jgi:hypothetical protein